MITSLKDDNGRIISYVEWRLVGKSGFDCMDGKYVWINDVWVHSEYRHANRLARMVDEVMRLVPHATHAYFKREKYKGRLKMFSKVFWERRRQAYEPINITKEF